MNWIDILKATFRPADEPLSPTARDFLRPTGDDRTAALYNSQTGEYAFSVGDDTPEEIAQTIAEETTHHAQDVVGRLDPDYREFNRNFNANLNSLSDDYLLPIAQAKLRGNENLIPTLAREFANTYFNLFFNQISEHILLESHAKESRNLRKTEKIINLADAYVLRPLDIYLALLPTMINRIQSPEILEYILPVYENFKTKLIAFLDKMVEDVIFEDLPNRTRKFRDFAMETIDTTPIDGLKEFIRNHVINNMEETMDSVKEELNA